MIQVIKSNKQNIIIFIILFILTLSLVYTSTFNPFNLRIMNVDTSTYVTIVQGITRGQVLYRDLADNKGPITHFISVPGFYFGKITGLWITEFIIIFIVFFFMYKTALLFVNYKTALITICAISLAMHPFYIVHAGTEVYSLPFLIISLYIFTKYYINKKSITLFEIFILGICFSCSIMIRFNMFPLWAGFCFIIVIDCIINKKLLDLFKFILIFICGIIIVLLPIFLYFIYYNLFDYFYIQVILGGISRGFQISLLQQFIYNLYIVINRSLSFIPLLIGIIFLLIKYNNINTFYYYGFILSYILSIIFISFSTGNSHYNLILIPFFVPALAFLSQILLNQFSKYKHSILAVLFCFCIIFSEGIARLSFYLFTNFDSGQQLQYVGRLIDELTEPDDEIISLGWNGYIYPFTSRSYASKYIYQSETFDHIPDAKWQFINDILTKKPRLITIYTAGDNQFKKDWHEEIYALIDKEYKLVSYDYGFDIYLRM